MGGINIEYTIELAVNVKKKEFETKVKLDYCRDDDNINEFLIHKDTNISQRFSRNKSYDIYLWSRQLLFN